MAGGPILPSSIYVGGAAGTLSVNYYIPTTNTNTAGAIEGIYVAASGFAADAPAVLQFNLPEVLPSGTLKLRLLFWANASTGNAIYTVADAGTAPASNIGATTLTTDASAASVTRSAVDTAQEIKVTLTGAGQTANNIYTVLLTFNHTSFTLAVTSVWQASLVWE